MFFGFGGVAERVEALFGFAGFADDEVDVFALEQAVRKRGFVGGVFAGTQARDGCVFVAECAQELEGEVFGIKRGFE